MIMCHLFVLKDRASSGDLTIVQSLLSLIFLMLYAYWPLRGLLCLTGFNRRVR